MNEETHQRFIVDEMDTNTLAELKIRNSNNNTIGPKVANEKRRPTKSENEQRHETTNRSISKSVRNTETTRVENTNKK